MESYLLIKSCYFMEHSKVFSTRSDALHAAFDLMDYCLTRSKQPQILFSSCTFEVWFTEQEYFFPSEYWDYIQFFDCVNARNDLLLDVKFKFEYNEE